MAFHNNNNGQFYLTDLREILEQNNLYDEVLNQINNRLSLRETMKEGQKLLSQGGRSNSI